jgi:glycosyltransferase 2 family protein
VDNGEIIMKYKAILLILVGLGVLVLMVLFIGPAKIENAIKMANPWYLALAVLIQLAIYGIWTERWAVTTSSLGISVKRRHLLPMLMVGLAINNLTPSGRGGGEPVRAYILGKYSRSPTENAFATVIADRGLDTFPFIALAVITIIATVFYLNLPQWMFITLIICLISLIVIFFVALYMSINREFGDRVIKFLLSILKRISEKRHNKIEKRAINAVEGFQNSMKVMLSDRRVFLYGIPLSFLIWALEILRVYVVFWALNINAPLEIIAAVFVISTLIGMIPLLPGGIGAVDGMMILLYSYAGIPPSLSAAATIVERLISFWMTTILGVAVLPYFGTDAVEKLSKKLK